MRHLHLRSGFTLIEVLVTSALIGLLGIIVFSLLTAGTVLGAKNTSTNTAHQQARVAILQMTKTLYASASTVVGVGTQSVQDKSLYSGITFQLASGDFLNPPRSCQITSATGGQTKVVISLNGNPIPSIKSSPALPPHFIVPGYQFDTVIKSITGTDPVQLTLADPLPDNLTVTDAKTVNVSCFTTDVCSYKVKNDRLEFERPSGSGTTSVLASGMKQSYPFRISDDGLQIRVNIATADRKSDRYFSSSRGPSLSDDEITITIPVKTASPVIASVP